MNALAIGSAFTYDPCGYLDAGDTGFCLFLVSLELINDGIRHYYSGNVLAHIANHSHVLRDDYSELDRYSELFCLFHESDESFRIEHSLGLEEFRAGHDLAFHLCELCVYRVAAGRYDSAFCEHGRFAHELVSAEIIASLQFADRMQQRDGIKIENRLGTGMVAELRVVAGEAQDVINAEKSSSQQVRLKRHAVAVTAGQLEDGVESGILQGLAEAQGAQAHYRGLVVGDVDCVYIAQILFCLSNEFVDMEPFGRSDLSSNDKFTLGKTISYLHIRLTPNL